MKTVIRKILLIIILLFSVFMFFACDEVENGDTNKDNNEDQEINNQENNNAYKVEMLNGSQVSGDGDMYDFYLRTKDGEKLTIQIIKTYDKDYLNRVKAKDDPEVTEDRSDIYYLSFDGETYHYNKREWQVIIEVARGKYLNYSRAEMVYGSISLRIGYTISDDPTITYEVWQSSMLSSILETAAQADLAYPIVAFSYFNDIAFDNDRIHSFSYRNPKEGTYESFYVDTLSRNTTVSLLNSLQFKKDLSELDVDSNSLNSSSETIMVSMTRHLIYDKFGLMLKGRLDKELLLYYVFYLEEGVVEMGYSALSSTINNLYAKMTPEQIAKIRTVLKEELKREYSLGVYQFSLEHKDVTIELKENNTAEITISSIHDQDGWDSIVVANGTYRLVDNPYFSEKELYIDDGDFYYVFDLATNSNKGLVFVESRSIAKGVFLDCLNENSIFYYKLRPIERVKSNNEYQSLRIYNLGDANKNISNEMMDYVKDKKNAYEDDELFNVTPKPLEDFCKIYKYKKSCETYLEYNGKIYPMGISFGGYGVTQVANYKTRDKHLLYFIFSWGSGIHRSNIWAFDFVSQEMKVVDCALNEEIHPIDVVFDNNLRDLRPDEDPKVASRLQLSIYQTRFRWYGNDPFKFNYDKEDLVIANILDCNLVPVSLDE